MPALILACNRQAELDSDAVPESMLDGVPDGSALFNEGHAGAEAQQLQGVEKDGVLPDGADAPADDALVFEIMQRLAAGAPQAGVSRGFSDPLEHLLTSFHTTIIVEFGGQLPTSPSFRPPDPADPRLAAGESEDSILHGASSAEVRKKRQVGPEVGPTSACCSCIPTGMCGQLAFLSNLTPFTLEASVG
jgi:hypothetical protein